MASKSILKQIINDNDNNNNTVATTIILATNIYKRYQLTLSGVISALTAVELRATSAGSSVSGPACKLHSSVESKRRT